MERGRIEECMSIREEIYQIVDELPESRLPALLRHLERLRAAEGDPFLAALMNAPIDDEPTTAEEDEGAAEARHELARGEGRPLRDIRDELLRG
jgi:hypothetical protein